MKQDLILHYSQLYRTPLQVQKFLRQIDYNRESTLRSAQSSLEKGRAHCLEGVFIAAALLEPHGYEPWVLSMESQDGLDHCLYIYKTVLGWGSIGKSRDHGLGGRLPKYRSLKNLVWSYFDPYVDKTGKITAWQVAHLDEVNCDWRRSRKSVWALENHLLEIKHHPLKSSPQRYKRNLKNYLRRGEIDPKPHWL